MKKKMGVLLAVIMMGAMMFGNLTTAYADDTAITSGVLADCVISVHPEFDANNIHQGETYTLSVSVTNNGTEAVNGVSVLAMMLVEPGEYPTNSAVSDATIIDTIGPGETKKATVTIIAGEPLLAEDGTMKTDFDTPGSKVTINAMASVSDESGIPQGQIVSEDVIGAIAGGTTGGNTTNGGSTDNGNSANTGASGSSNPGSAAKTSPKTGEQANVMMTLAAIMILAGISYIIADTKKRRYS